MCQLHLESCWTFCQPAKFFSGDCLISVGRSIWRKTICMKMLTSVIWNIRTSNVTVKLGDGSKVGWRDVRHWLSAKTFDEVAFVYATVIFTFLSFIITFLLQDQSFWNLKETKMLSKNFEMALTKVRNYEIQQ